MRIQPATVRDAPALARIHVDTWRKAYEGILPFELLASLTYEEREEMWRAGFASNSLHRHVFAAKDQDGNVVGFSAGGANRDASLPYDGEIYAIYLRVDLHRQGIGKHLLLESLEQLYRHGFLKSVLWVLADNPTRGFYERMGGKPVGEKWTEFSGTRIKEIAYGWPDILATLREFRPESRHPCVKHYSDLQEDDHFNWYPGSDEHLSIGAPFARNMGLKRLGIHHELLPPGRRTSWPHAEQDEEEFIYVLEGNPDVWIDGHTYRLNPGDGVAFPCGTGTSHTFINNSSADARLLIVGEASKKTSLIYYPLHPSRKEHVKDAWWNDVPRRPQGPHDGLPDTRRGFESNTR